MAKNIYVRSTTGNDANDGSSWATAKATIAGAAAIDVAGDTVFVSQAHVETSAATSVSWNFQQTPEGAVRVMCVEDAAEPPTALASSATVTLTHSVGTLYFNGDIYCQGLVLASNLSLAFGGNDDVQVYENCQFRLNSTSGATIRIPVATTVVANVYWKNASVSFNSGGSRIAFSGIQFHWQGGAFVPGTATPTYAFESGGARVSRVLIENVDFSSFDATFNLLSALSSNLHLVIRNCKLPANWSGGLIAAGGPTNGTCRAEMYNCDSADTNYRIWIKDFWGELRQETTLVRSGGAWDGATSYSWKVVTTANCNFSIGRFKSPELVQWNDLVGTPVTVTVEVLHDSLTLLKNDEIWLEVCYLGTSGYPLGSLASDEKANQLATAAQQASSTAAWDGTDGMSNPNKQKLSVTFTPQEKGFLHARVCVAKASYTLFVDPLLTIAEAA